MVTKRKPITAAELTERLSNDPDYRARMQALDKKRKGTWEKVRDEASPLMNNLTNAGCTVSDLNGLRMSAITYGQKAVPILMKWLPLIHHPQAKEIVVRALSVPAAKPVAARLLIEEFERTHSSHYYLKWAIGNALSVVADDSVIDQVIALATSKEHGKAREMVVESLGNMKDARAIEIATELLNDEQVAGHAVTALGNLRAKTAKPALEPFLKHRKAWIRMEAKKALKKIDGY